MPKKINYILASAYFCLTSLFLPAQEIDTTYALSPITVKSTRFNTKDIQSALALTAIAKNFIQRGQAQLSVNESLNTVPGLFALNPNNFAQDLRVSIRGFGARSAFGIRGIKILVDGIPESTPDGQAQVDNLALGVLSNIEVVRGPASSLYGNASGGVINFSTEEPSAEPFVEARILAGSYGLQQYQLKTGQQKGKFSYLLHGVHVQTDGYRENSGMKNTILNGKLGIQLNEKNQLKLLLNYGNSPQADDPGGINLDQVIADRTSARDRNLLFQGGETVEQFRAGLIYERAISDSDQLQLKAYHTYRDFANKLPFEFGGIVNFQRQFSGVSGQYQIQRNLSGKPYRLKIGTELENQADDRQRFRNLEGIQGDQTLDQKEEFLNWGTYLTQELDFTDAFTILLGLRYDITRFKATDQFLNNGDASGSSTLNNFNPTIGLVYSYAKDNSIYANISTSFETPTLNELSNNPSGNGGFNPDLQPQEATNYEIGFKGILSRKLRYEIAVFKIGVSNEILPFELEDFPGRDFFENAGSTNRTGVETSFTYNLTKGLTAYLNYTYSNFTFDDFEDFDGNTLPGIPKHSTFVAINYSNPKGFFTTIQSRFIGSIFTNNANSVTDDGYTVINLNLGYTKLFKQVTVEPFLGINNLLDEAYNDNIRINAFGSRFFEPAPEINVYGGIKIRF